MSNSAFSKFKSYKESINGYFILQIGPARCGTNFCLRALLQSPDVHNASKIYTMLHPFDSDAYWENMRADLETAKSQSNNGRPCLIHKDSTAFMSEQLKKQLFDVTDKVLIAVRDPLKHSVSLADTIMKDRDMLAANLSKKLNIHGELRQYEYLNSYAIDQGFQHWQDLINNARGTEEGFKHLNKLFRSFDFHNTNYAEILSRYKRGFECAIDYPLIMAQKTWNDLPEILSNNKLGEAVVIDTTTLQLETSGYMSRLCKKLGISFVPEMVHGWKKELPWKGIRQKAWISNAESTAGILPPTKPTYSPKRLPDILRDTLTAKINNYLSVVL